MVDPGSHTISLLTHKLPPPLLHRRRDQQLVMCHFRQHPHVEQQSRRRGPSCRPSSHMGRNSRWPQLGCNLTQKPTAGHRLSFRVATQLQRGRRLLHGLPGPLWLAERRRRRQLRGICPAWARSSLSLQMGLGLK